jgi:4-hydroxybenzoate polyprenyltransferase
MKWITKFIDFLLYGHFWIAAAAVAMAAQTEYILSGKLTAGNLYVFLFAATLSLYAAHRLLGRPMVRTFENQGRFRIIRLYQRYILLFGLIGAALGGWLFWQLPAKVQVGIFPPAILSLAYVLPVFGKRRRLRDLPFIKIFLIALVWAWVSVVLPALAIDLERNIPLWILFGERLFFIFAITLPFDWRDLNVDAHLGVPTLPAWLGLHRTRRLALVSLLLMLACAALNLRLNAYSPAIFLALVFSAALSYLFIHLANRFTHDYYFSGLLDGMMILQSGLVFTAGAFF